MATAAASSGGPRTPAAAERGGGSPAAAQPTAAGDCDATGEQGTTTAECEGGEYASSDAAPAEEEPAMGDVREAQRDARTPAGDARIKELLADLAPEDRRVDVQRLADCSLEQLAAMEYERLLGMGLCKVRAALLLARAAEMLGTMQGAAEEDVGAVNRVTPTMSRALLRGGSGLVVSDAYQASVRRHVAPPGVAEAVARGVHRIAASVASSASLAVGAVAAGVLGAGAATGCGCRPRSESTDLAHELERCVPATHGILDDALEDIEEEEGQADGEVQRMVSERSGGDPGWWHYATLGGLLSAPSADDGQPHTTPCAHEEPSLHLSAEHGVPTGAAIGGRLTMTSADYWCLRTMSVEYTDCSGRAVAWQETGYSLRCLLPVGATKIRVSFRALGGPEVQRVDRRSPGMPFVSPPQAERFRYPRCPESVQFEVAGLVVSPYISNVLEIGTRHLQAGSRGDALMEMPEVLCGLGAFGGAMAVRELRQTCLAASDALGDALAGLSDSKQVYICSRGAQVDADVVDRFCPATRRWEPLPPTRFQRRGCSAASAGGRLFLVGGWSPPAADGRVFGHLAGSRPSPTHLESPASPSASSRGSGLLCFRPEYFDPATRSWAPLPATDPEDIAGAATTAAGGLVYAIGGRSGGRALRCAQRFDPSAWRWEALPDLPSARAEAAAATLGGLVYALGGASDASAALRCAERFDPSAGAWMPLPPMREARCGCAAAAAGGLVFALGGLGPPGDLAGVEIFDPGVGAWSDAPPLGVPRRRCGAVAVDGKIYVLGGRGGEHDITAVEALDLDSMEWSTAGETPFRRGPCAAAAVSS